MLFVSSVSLGITTFQRFHDNMTTKKIISFQTKPQSVNEWYIKGVVTLSLFINNRTEFFTYLRDCHEFFYIVKNLLVNDSRYLDFTIYTTSLCCHMESQFIGILMIQFMHQWIDGIQIDLVFLLPISIVHIDAMDHCCMVNIQELTNLSQSCAMFLEFIIDIESLIYQLPVSILSPETILINQ